MKIWRKIANTKCFPNISKINGPSMALWQYGTILVVVDGTTMAEKETSSGSRILGNFMVV